MEYGKKITLSDITCPNCQGIITGEANCKHCGKEVIYGEVNASLLEKEGYAVDPTHRTEEAFKQWYIENAKSNSKLYKAGQGLTKVGSALEQGSKVTGHFANALLWMTLLLFMLIVMVIFIL